MHATENEPEAPAASRDDGSGKRERSPFGPKEANILKHMQGG